VNNVIETNQLLFQEKHIDIVNNIQHNIFLEADRLRIEELLNNLINNAVKYSNDGGSIYINTENSDDSTTVSIKDTGIGMTDDEIKHIFDEFYKADSSRHDFDSSGLGMPICKRIVEKHSGRIWAESDGGGKGSTFYFTLPRYQREKIEKKQNIDISYDEISSKVEALFIKRK
jgi:signal transduction histidine kinase